jgi:hypothetical protein
MAQTTSLRRNLREQFFDNSGRILSGGKLFYYAAGTTTPSNTYSNQGGTVANTNPVLLDAAGRINVPVYLTAANDFKELLTDSSGNTISPWPMDNIPAAVAPVPQASFAFPFIPWLQYTSSSSPITISLANIGYGFETDTSGGDVQFNLPAASTVGSGKGFWFKKTAAAHALKIVPNGTDDIEGANSTYTLYLNLQSVGLISDGAAWQAVAGLPVSKNPTFQRFTSGSGTRTFSAGMVYIEVIMVGGGAGGGASSTNNGNSGSDQPLVAGPQRAAQGAALAVPEREEPEEQRELAGPAH